MTPLETKLREYQMQAGQWLDRKRTLEVQAKEAARQAEMLQQRIAGINEAIDLMAVKVEPEPQIVLIDPKAFARKRTRSLSGNWQQIMQLVDGEKSFNYEALATAADVAGHPVTRDTLRSQMSLYKQGGLVDAVGDGEFRLTDAGRKAAGIATEIEGEAAPNENEPSNGNPEDGSETARLALLD